MGGGKKGEGEGRGEMEHRFIMAAKERMVERWGKEEIRVERENEREYHYTAIEERVKNGESEGEDRTKEGKREGKGSRWSKNF